MGQNEQKLGIPRLNNIDFFLNQSLSVILREKNII